MMAKHSCNSNTIFQTCWHILLNNQVYPIVNTKGRIDEGYCYSDRKKFWWFKEQFASCISICAALIRKLFAKKCWKFETRSRTHSNRLQNKRVRIIFSLQQHMKENKSHCKQSSTKSTLKSAPKKFCLCLDKRVTLLSHPKRRGKRTFICAKTCHRGRHKEKRKKKQTTKTASRCCSSYKGNP